MFIRIFFSYFFQAILLWFIKCPKALGECKLINPWPSSLLEEMTGAQKWGTSASNRTLKTDKVLIITSLAFLKKEKNMKPFQIDLYIITYIVSYPALECNKNLRKDVWKCWSGSFLLPRLLWPTVRKNCSCDREHFFMRSLEEFIQKVNGQNISW